MSVSCGKLFERAGQERWVSSSASTCWSRQKLQLLPPRSVLRCCSGGQCARCGLDPFLEPALWPTALTRTATPHSLAGPRSSHVLGLGVLPLGISFVATIGKPAFGVVLFFITLNLIAICGFSLKAWACNVIPAHTCVVLVANSSCWTLVCTLAIANHVFSCHIPWVAVFFSALSLV